jgi:hypothetical protein
VRRIVALVAVALAAALGGLVVGTQASDDTCSVDEVRLDGECEAARPGKPAAPPERADHAAHVIIDEDPPALGLDGHCSFQGIAAGRVDLYTCAMQYMGRPVVMRVENERGTWNYRWAVVSNPQRIELSSVPEGATSGLCTFDPERGPPCAPTGD